MAEGLSPLQLIFYANLSNNVGITLGADLTTAINNYQSTSLISPFSNALSNVGSANLSAPTIGNLTTLASSTCPALADSTPAAYASNIGLALSQYQAVNATPSLGNSTSGFTGIISSIGNDYLGNGNLSIFAQIFPAAIGYTSQTNDFINSVNAVQTQIATTFTSYDSLITANLSDVNLAMPVFGDDMAKAGLAIDLSDLENLGSPAALLRQIYRYVGLDFALKNALVAEGVSLSVLDDIQEPDYQVEDSVNQKIYVAFTKINTTTAPDTLTQILQTLLITTLNIQSLADLLNPVKLFPNSFQTLTVKTSNGLKPIYTNSSGTVNSNLLTLLPAYFISTVADI